MPRKRRGHHDGEHHRVAKSMATRMRSTAAARIQPAQHVTDVWGHPPWTIIGPELEHVPPTPHSGTEPSTRHST